MSKHTPGPWERCSASDGNCKCSHISGPDPKHGHILVAKAYRAVPDHPVPNLGEATGITADELREVLGEVLDNWLIERDVHPCSKKDLDTLISTLLKMHTHAAYTMDGDEDLPATDDEEVYQANKRLIAAAPELLDACRLALDDLQVLAETQEDLDLCRQLKEAIKKC